MECIIDSEQALVFASAVLSVLEKMMVQYESTGND